MAETKDVLWFVTPDDGVLGCDAGTQFWKELIREGRWVNAKAGFTLEVDGERLGQWERSFHEMADAGIRVPVPWGHSYDPRDNAGFVEEIELRDGGLWALLNVPDEGDAAKLGSTVRAVSVSINPGFVDGSGRDWGEVIEHVALTNYPVVTDQEDFIQASSDGGEGKRAIMLEREQGQETREMGQETRKTGQGTGDEGLEEQGTGTRGQGPGSNRAEPATQDSEPGTQNFTRRSLGVGGSELATRNSELGTQNSELTNRLYQLELERAEREVDEALRLGKFTRPAAEALRQLVAAGVERKYSFGADGAVGVDVSKIVLDVIANTPAGAALDMAEHTRVHIVPDPSGAAMTDEKAAQLARENKALAGV